MSLTTQVIWLLLLAVPIACVSWTVTHEEVFSEPRDLFVRLSTESSRWYVRKFFYMLVCEYCFSHYVAVAVAGIAGYRLLFPDWRGFLLGWFALVWIANVYMSIFVRLRLDIKRERIEIAKTEDPEVPDSGGPGKGEVGKGKGNTVQRR